MGKSTNASYVDKSNFQLLKDKLKEKKRVNQKLKSDVKEKHCESKKKTKRSLWTKWLTSVRQSWSCGEPRKPQLFIGRSLDESVYLFQMSTDPERKASEMVVQPDETELKTVPTECRGSLCPEGMFPKERPVSRNDSQPNGPVKKDKTKINRDPFKTHCRSLVKNTKVANGAKEPPRNIEPLLTSALFIHKDLDKMVESAVFMEPRLPRDYAESKPSDEISQRSLRINNMRVSYKGKEKDEITETFKTTSEPSWKERKKLIHRQRLDENIKYLVKQFVFLGTKDIIDFPRQRKQINPFNHSSGSTSRNLSRQVSPEILVNIKPFKEYLSDNSVSCQKSSKRTRLGERQFRLPKNRPIRAPRKADMQKVSEKCLQPVLRSTATLLKKNNSVQAQENSLKNKLTKQNESVLTLSPVKSERSRVTWSEDASEDLTVETQSFSFWDMHKTYSKCENFVQVEVQLGNSSFQFKHRKREERVRADLEGEENALPNSSSLDKVLDALEDGDHNLIFQKNLSQFKKKIPAMPRLDLRKPTFGTSKRESQKVEDKVWQKLITLETENHNEQKFVKIEDFSLGNSMEKKIEICRSKCLNLRPELLWKSEKVLENIYLMFCESTVISQILATRVEAKMFSLCQPLREVHDMQENNIVVVIRVENPKNFDETSKRIELLSETPALLQKSRLILPKQSETITMFIYTNLNPRKIMEKSATFEIGDNCTHFQGASHSDGSSLIKFSFEEALRSKFLEFLKEMKTDEKDWNETKEIEPVVKRKTFQTLAQVGISDKIERRVALILNDPFYDYTAHMYEKKMAFFQHCRKFYSEPNVLRKLVYDKKHRSDSAVIYKTTKMENLEASKGTSCHRRSRNFSGFSTNDFQVLCHSSNENLKNSEEEITISCRYFTGKHVTLLTAENTKANKKEKQKEIDDLKSEKKAQHQIRNYIPRETKSLEKCLAKKTKGKIETPISNFVQCSKIRACLDEVEKAFIRIKPEFDQSLAIPIQLMLKQEGEADKRITFQLRKRGANLKKELVAAINLIKSLNTSKREAKGSSKQMSLIILFSKTKLLSKN